MTKLLLIIFMITLVFVGHANSQLATLFMDRDGDYFAPFGMSFNNDGNIMIFWEGGTERRLGIYDNSKNRIALTDLGGTELVDYSVFGIVQASNNYYYWTATNAYLIFSKETIDYEPVTLSTAYQYPSGMKKGVDGSIYGVFKMLNGIADMPGIFKITDNVISTFASLGTSSDVEDIAIDGSMNLYISDYGNDCIWKYDAEGNLTKFVTSGLDDPIGIDFDHNGNLWVASRSDSRIHGCDPSGNIRFTVEPSDGVSDPRALKFDQNGNMFFTDSQGVKFISYEFLPHTFSYTLTASKGGTGLGSLTAPGLTCDGNTCTGTYTYNETVRITATADAGSVFAGWTGCNSATDNVCTVLINDDQEITALFVPYGAKEYNLQTKSVAKNKGNGTILSSDGNINCGDICAHKYFSGTTVTLSATANEGSTFIGWKPESLNCVGTAACTIEIGRSKTVKAVFVGDYTLKVVNKSKNGGTGTVTSTPKGIDCTTGNTIGCEELYGYGETVTLSASADMGYVFVGWAPSKLCPGVGDCVVPMDRKRTVKAIFSRP